MAKQLDIASSVTPNAELAITITKTAKEKAKEKMQELIKEETRMVKGIFQCFETPGATVKITLKKYPGVPTFDKTMTDGETYDVPLYVARHLNGIDASAGAAADPSLRNPNIGTCSYAVHGFKWGANNQPPACAPGGEVGIPVPMVGIAKRVKRFGFQSMEFAGAI